MIPVVGTPLQQALRLAEASLAEPLLQAVFGLRLAYVGDGSGLPLLDASPVEYQVHVQLASADESSVAASLPCVKSDGQRIPLLSEAFDAVVLYHALEQSEDPHSLLREAERILRPSGFLILVGYRRMSLLGLAHWLGRFESTRAMQLLGTHRLKDWLKLLGLRLLSTDYAFYRYPWSGMGLRLMAWLERLGVVSRAPLGGISVMMARKDVFGMTALHARNQQRLHAGLLAPAPMSNRIYNQSRKDT
ncbi:MAG TPA: class I SAM-dependent methyltransferase [Pseudomonadales bacterium]